jgi:hypothetical protein
MTIERAEKIFTRTVLFVVIICALLVTLISGNIVQNQLKQANADRQWQQQHR